MGRRGHQSAKRIPQSLLVPHRALEENSTDSTGELHRPTLQGARKNTQGPCRVFLIFQGSTVMYVRHCTNYYCLLVWT